MYTNRQIVSDIRSFNKLLSSDQMITDRAIMSAVKDATNLIVQQQLNKRQLWQSPNLFAYFPCLEMQKVPITECCEYTANRDVAKSIKKLPRIGEGQWGLAIQGVFGLDNMKKFKESTPSRFANLLKLGLKTKDIFFWVINDHLYVSNPDTKAVNIFLYPAELITDNSLLFPGEDCDCMQKPDIEDLCASPLDQPFYAPQNRVEDIKKIVYQNLMRTYFSTALDKSANQLDETSK